MVLEKSLTHSPLEVLPKNAFEASRTVFLVTVVLLRAKTYHKAVYRLYSSQPSDPVAKYWLAKFEHTQKAKFRHNFWV